MATIGTAIHMDILIGIAAGGLIWKCKRINGNRNRQRNKLGNHYSENIDVSCKF